MYIRQDKWACVGDLDNGFKLAHGFNLTWCVYMQESCVCSLTCKFVYSYLISLPLICHYLFTLPYSFVLCWCHIKYFCIIVLHCNVDKISYASYTDLRRSAKRLCPWATHVTCFVISGCVHWHINDSVLLSANTLQWVLMSSYSSVWRIYMHESYMFLLTGISTTKYK